MSRRLVDEVLEHGPEDLSGPELALLLILADKSQDEDRTVGGRRIPARTCFPGIEQLGAWMRLRPDGVRKVLRKLEDRGLQVRVPVGQDKAGRPVYAARGHQTLYRVPVMASAESVDSVDNSDKGQPTGWAIEDKGQPTGWANSEKGQPTGTQRPANWPPKASQLAGPKRKEPKVNHPPTPQGAEASAPTSAGTATRRAGDSLEDLAAIAAGVVEGMTPAEAVEVARLAVADPETKMPRRRLEQAGYVRDLLGRVRSAAASSRREARRSGARCEDHSTEPADGCGICPGEVKGRDRDARFVGKRQPLCREATCLLPIVPYEDGATLCAECEKQALDNEEVAA